MTGANSSEILGNDVVYRTGLGVMCVLAATNTVLAVVNLVKLARYKLIDPGARIILAVFITAILLSHAKLCVEGVSYLVLIAIGQFAEVAHVKNIQMCRTIGLLLSLPSTVLIFISLPFVYYLYQKVKSMNTSNDSKRGLRISLAAISLATALTLAAIAGPSPETSPYPVCDVGMVLEPSVALFIAFMMIMSNCFALFIISRLKKKCRSLLMKYEWQMKTLNISQRVLIERNVKLSQAVFPGIAGQTGCYVIMLLFYCGQTIVEGEQDLATRAAYSIYSNYLTYCLGSLSMSVCLRKIFTAGKAAVEPSSLAEQDYRLSQLKQQWDTAMPRNLTPN